MGGFDTIQFGAGITAAKLVVTQEDSGVDMVLSIKGTTDKITIKGGAAGHPDYHIEQVRFVDGSTLSYDQLIALSAKPVISNYPSNNEAIANSTSGRPSIDKLTGGDIGSDMRWAESDRFVYTDPLNSLHPSLSRATVFQGKDYLEMRHTVSTDLVSFSHSSGLPADLTVTFPGTNFVSNGASLLASSDAVVRAQTGVTTAITNLIV